MKLRDWITLGAAVVLIVTAFVWGMRCGAEKPSSQIVVRDTLRLKETISDTVIRWYERIIYKEVEPETVSLYPDTIRPDTIWGRWPEAILALDYRKGDLHFTSIAPTDESGDDEDMATLKGYSYKVGESFSIRAKGEGFHVRKLRPGLTFGFQIGADARVWGDTAAAKITPFAQASLNWQGVSLGPRLDTRGLHLTLKYTWK